MLSIIGLLKRLRGTQRALARTLALVVLFVALAAHTVTAADADSFEPIFNGKTLSGWEGDPTYWRVENGALVGEITPATLLKRNSFILWRGGEVEDFELKLQYRVSSKGNSGIGYRCVPIEGEPWAVRGYQADIEGDDNWTGINYEERGRTFLAHRGQKTIVEPGERPRLVEQFARPEELQARVRKNDWNDYHVIVRGSRMIHILNGHLMSEVLDRDGRLGQRRGLLGVQVHVGPPMTIEYRNILLKHLAGQTDEFRQGLPPAEKPPLKFDNPTALADLRRQAARLMQPPPQQPLPEGRELTLASKVHFVRSDLVAGKEPAANPNPDHVDLVLIDSDRVVRVPAAPEPVKQLSWAKTYTFKLRWDDAARGGSKRHPRVGLESRPALSGATIACSIVPPAPRFPRRSMLYDNGYRETLVAECSECDDCGFS